MAPPTERDTTPAYFRQYNRLPVELRIMILKAACPMPAPRYIEEVFSPANALCDVLDDLAQTFTMMGTMQTLALYRGNRTACKDVAQDAATALDAQLTSIEQQMSLSVAPYDEVYHSYYAVEEDDGLYVSTKQIQPSATIVDLFKGELQWLIDRHLHQWKTFVSYPALSPVERRNQTRLGVFMWLKEHNKRAASSNGMLCSSEFSMTEEGSTFDDHLTCLSSGKPWTWMNFQCCKTYPQEPDIESDFVAKNSDEEVVLFQPGCCGD